MVTGRVVSEGQVLEPTINLTVYSDDGRSAIIHAIVDTGFTDYLTLSPEVIHTLGLQFEGEEGFLMADGTEVLFQVYTAIVDWSGQRHRVDIHCSKGNALVGMAMLRNHDLYIRAVPDGTVRIDPVA